MTQYYKNLTSQQKTNIKLRVKRVNERLRDIEKTFGTNSQIYQNWLKDIRKTSGFNEEQYMKGAKNLIRASEVNENDVKILEYLVQKNTKAMQLRQNIQTLKEVEEYKKLSKEEITKEAILYEQQKQDLHNIIVANADAIYNWSTSITERLHDGWNKPLTYDEMQDLLKGYNSKWTYHREIDENRFKEM